jgi:hypothetical protein
MTDYTIISNTQVEPEAPVTSELMNSLRDNPLAIAEGATAAPRVALKAISGTNTAIKSGLEGYQGGYFIVEYYMATGQGGSGSAVLEFSNDGATFPGTLTLDTIGSENVIAKTDHIQVDFATGDYVRLLGSVGTVGSMPTDPTHFRLTVISNSGASGFVLAMPNGGNAAS